MIHINVERIREARGMTKTAFAKRLGLTTGGYHHLAIGNVRWLADRLQKAAHILDVDISVFYNDELTDSVISKIQDKVS